MSGIFDFGSDREGDGEVSQYLASLAGVMERLVFSNAEGWGIAQISTQAGAKATVTGYLAHLKPGQSVSFGGLWKEHKKFGRQFVAESVRVLAPSTAEAVQRYLESIDGVGRGTAKAILEDLGPNCLEVIRESPERLAGVFLIGPQRAEAIRASILSRTQDDDNSLELSKYGVPNRFIPQILKRYGSNALKQVTENPYQLITSFAGIGFKTADAIARMCGVTENSPERVAAGIVHVLKEATQEGHVFLTAPDLAVRGRKLLGVDPEAIRSVTSELAEKGVVIVEEEVVTKWGARFPESVFLGALHSAECRTAINLRAINSGESRDPWHEAPEGKAEKEEGIEYSEEQLKSVAEILSPSPPFVNVVTGGPGTGKTTILKLLVRVSIFLGLRVALGAPTGRASRRLADATGRGAGTIHRLLEFNPRSGRFGRDAKNFIDADIVIIDESSMLDINLAAHLTCAVSPSSRIVFVGDVDQLPSVGPGKFLEDLIAAEDSGMVRVNRLTQVFRQAAESGIIRAAYRVNAGRPPEEDSASADDRDLFLTMTTDPERAKRLAEVIVSERIPAKFGIATSEVQVLTPTNKGTLGTRSLNESLQLILNPDGERIGSRPFRIGDRILVTKNKPEYGVFNGDIGKIVLWNQEDKFLEVEFYGRRMEVDETFLSLCSLAYATTIHKSQGSEYTAVVVVMAKEHGIMLERRLFYTAITRAKKLLVIVGDPESLARAARNSKASDRNTRLAQRIADPDFGKQGGGNLASAFFGDDQWTCLDCFVVFVSEAGPSAITVCPECGSSSVEKME